MYTGCCSLSIPGLLIDVDELVQMKLELTEIFSPDLKCVITHDWKTSDIFSLFLYFHVVQQKRRSKHWKPQKETSRQKMPDLQEFTGLIWIDVHKSHQNKAHLSLFGGIKFFWKELIGRHFLQTLNTLTVDFPVAGEFWGRCFCKSKDWLYKRKSEHPAVPI